MAQCPAQILLARFCPPQAAVFGIQPQKPLRDGSLQGQTYPSGAGYWRAPWGLYIVCACVVLLVGFGGGFGAGWAAKPSYSSSGGATSVTVSSARAAAGEGGSWQLRR